MAEINRLHRRAAVAELLSDRKDMLIVTGLGSPTYDVFAAGDHPGNFYLWGAMGGAALTGLGLALAQPNRPVTVVTGPVQTANTAPMLAESGSDAAPALTVGALVLLAGTALLGAASQRRRRAARRR